MEMSIVNNHATLVNLDKPEKFLHVLRASTNPSLIHNPNEHNKGRNVISLSTKVTLFSVVIFIDFGLAPNSTICNNWSFLMTKILQSFRGSLSHSVPGTSILTHNNGSLSYSTFGIIALNYNFFKNKPALIEDCLQNITNIFNNTQYLNTTTKLMKRLPSIISSCLYPSVEIIIKARSLLGSEEIVASLQNVYPEAIESISFSSSNPDDGTKLTIITKPSAQCKLLQDYRYNNGTLPSIVVNLESIQTYVPIFFTSTVTTSPDTSTPTNPHNNNTSPESPNTDCNNQPLVAVVKWFNKSSRTGFLTVPSGKDIFLCNDSLTRQATLTAGDQVSYEVKTSTRNGKPIAMNIKNLTDVKVPTLRSNVAPSISIPETLVEVTTPMKMSLMTILKKSNTSVSPSPTSATTPLSRPILITGQKVQHPNLQASPVPRVKDTASKVILVAGEGISSMSTVVTIQKSPPRLTSLPESTASTLPKVAQSISTWVCSKCPCEFPDAEKKCISCGTLRERVSENAIPSSETSEAIDVSVGKGMLLPPTPLPEVTALVEDIETQPTSLQPFGSDDKVTVRPMYRTDSANHIKVDLTEEQLHAELSSYGLSTRGSVSALSMRLFYARNPPTCLVQIKLCTDPSILQAMLMAAKQPAFIGSLPTLRSRVLTAYHLIEPLSEKVLEISNPPLSELSVSPSSTELLDYSSTISPLPSPTVVLSTPTTPSDEQ